MYKKSMQNLINYYLKQLMYYIWLPMVYWIASLWPINPKLILFADSQHTNMPFSMQSVRDYLNTERWQIREHIFDLYQVGKVRGFLFFTRFMIDYAQSSKVFICDYFFPISSCRRRKDTQVVQLWHSGGLLKKFGYDCSTDVINFPGLNPFKNYDFVTVSSLACIPIWSSAMRLCPNKVIATGICRTDYYFQEKFISQAYAKFYNEYPEARHKTIILWAPTFRNKASEPKVIGMNAIEALKEKLGNEFFLIIKVHPHIQKRQAINNSSLLTEELLMVADLLITDYSSVLFDYSLLYKPFLIFAPDYEEYFQDRGFYSDLSSFPCIIIRESDISENDIKKAFYSFDKKLHEDFLKFHMSSCDGKSTKRILNYIGLE